MPPKRIDVLGKSWSIAVEEIADGDYGVCKHATNQIAVHPKQSKDNLRDSVLHEILHALDVELSTHMGERRVRLTATGLLQVLRANKALTAFLTE